MAGFSWNPFPALSYHTRGRYAEALPMPSSVRRWRSHRNMVSGNPQRCGASATRIGLGSD
jgi:hypothetical protein